MPGYDCLNKKRFNSRRGWTMNLRQRRHLAISVGYICVLPTAVVCEVKISIKKTNVPQVKLLTCHEHKNIKLLIFLYFLTVSKYF